MLSYLLYKQVRLPINLRLRTIQTRVVGRPISREIPKAQNNPLNFSWVAKVPVYPGPSLSRVDPQAFSRSFGISAARGWRSFFPGQCGALYYRRSFLLLVSSQSIARYVWFIYSYTVLFFILEGDVSNLLFADDDEPRTKKKEIKNKDEG